MCEMRIFYDADWEIKDANPQNFHGSDILLQYSNMCDRFDQALNLSSIRHQWAG